MKQIEIRICGMEKIKQIIFIRLRISIRVRKAYVIPKSVCGMGTEKGIVQFCSRFGATSCRIYMFDWSPET